MDNYNIINVHCKKAHYGAWTQEAIEECIKLLPKLTHDELFALRTSRWFRDNPHKHPLYEMLVGLLHKEHFDNVFNELEKLDTLDLVARFKELKANSCKKKCLEILFARFRDMSENEQETVKPILVKNHFINLEKKD